MFIFANVNIYLILKNNMKRLVITIIFAFALFVDLFGRQMNNNDEVCEVAAVHFPQLNETVDNEDDEERIALFVFYKNMENVKVVLYENEVLIQKMYIGNVVDGSQLSLNLKRDGVYRICVYENEILVHTLWLTEQ